MTVDGREFSGKNAREEAGTALIQVIMASLWEDSKELKLKRLGDYKDFAIMSSFSSHEGETPKLYLRGKHTYEANLNPENALGTIASIEYALRRLDATAKKKSPDLNVWKRRLPIIRDNLTARLSVKTVCGSFLSGSRTSTTSLTWIRAKARLRQRIRSRMI